MTTRSSPASGPAPPSPTVLVVDDDPGVRQFIRWALEDEGLQVRTAADGARALEEARRNAPDLLVLDLTLPVLAGPAVAEHLRKDFGERFPILVITADGNAPAKAASVGAFAYLHKPFSVDDLLAAVRRGLGPDRGG